MCDLGAAVGLATGVFGAISKSNQSERNIEMIRQQAKLDNAAQQREFIVEGDASNKEQFDAWREQQRAKSYMRALAKGEGNVHAMRFSEQGKQGDLNIRKAKDRREAAQANHKFGQTATYIQANNRAATERYTKAQGLTDIITSGIGGYGTIKRG